MAKYKEELSDEEMLAKNKRHTKKVKARSLTSKIKNALKNKKLKKRQDY